MGIFSRTRDIVAANMAELLEKAEDPAKMIRMIILEMEETLVEVRASAARTIADSKEMRRHIAKLETLEANWTEKAELALSKDREDLAKAALVEKASVITTVELLDSEMLKLDETLDKLSHEIDQLQSKLNDARARQKTIVMRTTATQSRVDVNRQLHNFNIDNAMNKFEYYEKKIDLMEGQVESMTRESKGLHSEFEELARKEKIDLELQAIKSKLNK